MTDVDDPDLLALREDNARRLARAEEQAAVRDAHAKRVHTTPYSEWDVETLIREELRLGYAKAIGMPMDFVDGRPWVREHDVEHDPMLWGNGLPDGCGHVDCGGTADGRNLVGIMNAEGIKAYRR